jgi:DNA-binding XRE family transcriptional regulator
MKKSFKEFGQYIKQARIRAQLTQAGLSSLVGMSPQFISNCERGKARPPLKHMKKLIQVLKLRPAETANKYSCADLELVRVQLAGGVEK